MANKQSGMDKDPHYCQNGHYERDQAAKNASGGPASATQAAGR
jgi:hypothetical protein